MFALNRRRDPAPSKTGFRLRRLWRSRMVRRAVVYWAPAAMMAGLAAWAFSLDEVRSAAEAELAELEAALMTRPEIAVKRLVVNGATPRVEAMLRADLADLVGASSMAVDARTVRDRAEALGWVASANVRLEAPETLYLTIREQRPVALWRRGERLALLARDGAEIDLAAARADHPELPVLAGAGAERAVREALALTDIAGHLAPRLRGLVRIGERRWNVVFHEAATVMLPAEGALDAFAYFVSLDAVEDVLARDVRLVDLRVKSRRTLRLGPDAQDALAERRKPKAPGEDA